MKPAQVVATDSNFTETRKVSLYSNFERLKSTNEFGYEANVAAWRSVLIRCVEAGCFADKTCLDTSNLITDLMDPKNGTPLALNYVLDEMVQTRDLVPLRQWLDSTRPLLRTEWSLGAASAALGSWALSKVFNTAWNSGSPGKLKAIRYVSVSTVEKEADKLLKQLTNKSKANGENLTSKVFSYEDLGLSKTDIEVCVTYLRREKQRGINFDSKHEIVALAPTVSEEHLSVAAIQRQMSVLSSRIDQLQAKVTSLDSQARTAVRAKQTAVAKQRLRSKHDTEKALSRTLDLYTQLETVLGNVDIASDQSSAIQVLEQSSKLLKKVNSTVGSADRVSELVDSIQDDIADTEEITAELGRITLSEPVDEDIELELEQMEAEAKAAKLPSVPSGEPSGVSSPAKEPSDTKQAQKEGTLPEKSELAN